MFDWIKPYCTKIRGQKGILDGFNSEYFIAFDCEEDPELPKSKNTCDILICPLLTDDWLANSIRITSNANEITVKRFLFAIDNKNFPEKVKQAMYNRTSPLRNDNV